MLGFGAQFPAKEGPEICLVNGILVTLSVPWVMIKASGAGTRFNFMFFKFFKWSSSGSSLVLLDTQKEDWRLISLGFEMVSRGTRLRVSSSKVEGR